MVKKKKNKNIQKYVYIYLWERDPWFWEVDFFVTNKSNENKLSTRKRRCRVQQDAKRQ